MEAALTSIASDGMNGLANFQGGLSLQYLPTEPGEEPLIVRRDDGSWLMDGGLDLDTVLRTIDTESLLSDDEDQHYHTLGGLAMAALGRVPRTADVFERRGYRFEVVDMDGNRVDRVLVSQTSPASGSGPAASPRHQD